LLVFIWVLANGATQVVDLRQDDASTTEARG
jgi:hypothetical protein